MNIVVLLDSTPLGQITHPNIKPEIRNWLQNLNEQNIFLLIPEIVDYELRRQLLLNNREKSISRLDAFIKNRLILINRETILKACELWAWIRQQGLPTADSKNIDGDVILVAQAILQKEFYDQVIIVTENVKHLSRFNIYGINVTSWSDSLKDNFLLN